MHVPNWNSEGLAGTEVLWWVNKWVGFSDVIVHIYNSIQNIKLKCGKIIIIINYYKYGVNLWEIADFVKNKRVLG